VSTRLSPCRCCFTAFHHLFCAIFEFFSELCALSSPFTAVCYHTMLLVTNRVPAHTLSSGFSGPTNHQRTHPSFTTGCVNEAFGHHAIYFSGIVVFWYCGALPLVAVHLYDKEAHCGAFAQGMDSSQVDTVQAIVNLTARHISNCSINNNINLF